MNRIVLIGNGFDLAHGLKTGYTHFMDWYWTEFAKKIHDGRGVLTAHEDDLARFDNGGAPTYSSIHRPDGDLNSSGSIQAYIKKCKNPYITLTFENKFWEHLSDRAYLQSWLDIEIEYYALLKDFLSGSRSYLHIKNWPEVKDLNEEFRAVKNLLKEYISVSQKEIERKPSIVDAIKQPLMYDDVAISRREVFWSNISRKMPSLIEMKSPFLKGNAVIKQEADKDPDKYLTPDKTIFLNFNYTKTAEKLYKRADDVVINIHGELDNPKNKMIFGYGDELDEDYRAIERALDNDFLENIKSIQYHNTGNYRLLLGFLEDEPYQVFVMGHSCGNSDRTLLNTIFEHRNCISVKPFYHQWKDEATGVIEDNYTQLVMNISRNFNNKQNLRDIVVSQERCHPLVPCEK